jgi:hypothetical protein
MLLFWLFIGLFGTFAFGKIVDALPCLLFPTKKITNSQQLEINMQLSEKSKVASRRALGIKDDLK